jgi:hypothetical protein
MSRCNGKNLEKNLFYLLNEKEGAGNLGRKKKVRNNHEGE